MTSVPSQDKTEKAFRTALRLLSFRERSENEIRLRLKQKKFTKKAIEQTVRYLLDEGLLNDRRFTRSWISSRLERHFGLKKICLELREKGIAKQLIEEEINHIRNAYPEEEIIADLAKKRINKYKDIGPLKAKQRTFNYLMARGFSPEIIRHALNAL